MNLAAHLPTRPSSTLELVRDGSSPGDWRAAFEAATQFTVGVEEELLLVSRDDGSAAPIADLLLPYLEDDSRFARELHACQVEVITPPSDTVAGITRHLVEARARLRAELGREHRLVGAGTHPVMGELCRITDQQRYHEIASHYAWAASHAVPCGMHVHVAVPGAERALAVFNALRSYLPLLAALGANSPYLHGHDTGMASIRGTLNHSYPRAGVPPVLRDFEELAEFERWGRRGGAFDDWTNFWWDMRLSLHHGTIEVRVFDAQTSTEDAAALTAVVQSLAHHLATEFDRDGRLPVHDTWRITENAWLAQRFGVAGHQVDLDSGERLPTAAMLNHLLRELSPSAAQLDCLDELAYAATLVATNGAHRQRTVVATHGMPALVAWLADATERT